jgi:hypothetical protein
VDIWSHGFVQYLVVEWRNVLLFAETGSRVNSNIMVKRTGCVNRARRKLKWLDEFCQMEKVDLEKVDVLC